MDINDLRGISTALLMVAFLGVCFWAYSKKRRAAFDEAAKLPFADEAINRNTLREEEKEANNG